MSLISLHNTNVFEKLKMILCAWNFFLSLLTRVTSVYPLVFAILKEVSFLFLIPTGFNVTLLKILSSLHITHV